MNASKTLAWLVLTLVAMSWLGVSCKIGRGDCSNGESLCGQRCVNLLNAVTDCGSCGIVCPAGVPCVRGRCESAKPPPDGASPGGCPDKGYSMCDGLCVNTRIHGSHCGACGQACAEGKGCFRGQCQCPPGTLDCNGRCVDPFSNTRHCGGCGLACEAGKLCSNSQCVESCPSSAPTNCSGACVDTQNDPRHCGACSKACRVGMLCVQGQCSCAPGLEDCGGECVASSSDIRHCGRCAQGCASGQACAESRCVTTCPSSTPTRCLGGCVDTQTHPQHCGTCNTRCRGGQLCIDGRCSCLPGRLFCNGECVDPGNHRGHCGGCERRCSAGEICSEGHCLKECPKTTPQVCRGGCFQTDTSTQHCGACGTRCLGGQICFKGKCICPQGQLYCGGVCVDPKNHPRHCGICNNGCDAGQVCSFGSCVDACTRERPSLCYGGCVDPSSDPRHCGACGKRCLGGKTCAQGKCICPSGLEDCAGLCVNINANARHCGRCGGNCPAGQACLQGSCGQCPTGQIPCQGSCIDPAKNPLKEECNGKDDNCDGTVDEGCGCNAGETLPCGSDVGECKAGKRPCIAGSWGACEGQLSPQPEVCNGKDDNCDGKVDEFCGCKAGETRPCGSDVGACKKGTQDCVNDTWGPCKGAVGPKPEECNGVDDDCDGTLDKGCKCQDGEKRSCGVDTGACSQGSQTCQAGVWGVCQGEIKPIAESCDGQDNDCDGSIDEGLHRGCYTGPQGTEGKGECKGGSQKCEAGTWSACTQQRTPSPEVCDGKDNDCDGKTDESLSQACYTGPSGTEGKGECKPGTQACSGGKWGSCSRESKPSKEVCDGKDNDCDGQTDEGCQCKVGETRSCGTDTGECKKGTQSCVNGKWGSCTGGVGPKAETCGSKDVDCDGKIGCADPDCNGRSCNDNNSCTYSDKCKSGKCSGTKITCSSTSCVTRTCQGTSTCKRVNQPSGKNCSSDGNSCTNNVCDGRGNCTHPRKSDGTICGFAQFCCAGKCVTHATNNRHCGGCYKSCGSYPCYAFQGSGLCRCVGNAECRTFLGPTATCYHGGSGNAYRCNCQSDADCGPKQRCNKVPGHNYCVYK